MVESPWQREIVNLCVMGKHRNSYLHLVEAPDWKTGETTQLVVTQSELVRWSRESDLSVSLFLVLVAAIQLTRGTR